MNLLESPDSLLIENREPQMGVPEMIQVDQMVEMMVDDEDDDDEEETDEEDEEMSEVSELSDLSGFLYDLRGRRIDVEEMFEEW